MKMLDQYSNLTISVYKGALVLHIRKQNVN